MHGRKLVKDRFRPVFVALQADAKRFDGGIAELARLMGRNPQVVSNMLNPNSDATPTAEVVLDVIELAQATTAVNAIALLVGQAAVDVSVMDRSPRQALEVFMTLVQDAGAATKRAAAALQDGRLDARERNELGPLLDALIAAAVEFRAVVRG
ncbi:MAG: hypothetical protein HGA47_09930 [Zoogloea sp.]|nr:hypothetical protein [Zoogloea sp.]